MAVEDVIRLLARFGEFYWEPDGVRDRQGFVAVTEADWPEALIYFVEEFAYERQGASRDYVVAAVKAIRAHAENGLSEELPEAVWEEFRRLLSEEGGDKGTNKKIQPIAPSYGGSIGMIEFVLGLGGTHNIVDWAREACASGHVAAAYSGLIGIRGIGEKIASFFLRDVIRGFELDESAVPAYCFQPIDVWTGRTARALAPSLELPVPDVPSAAAGEVLVVAAEKSGVSAADLNAGAWLFGARFLASNVEFTDALRSEAALISALDRARERMEQQARRTARRVEFIHELSR